MNVKRRAFTSNNPPPPTGNPNYLLAALPVDDYQRIVPTLDVVPFKRSHTCSLDDLRDPHG